MDLCALPSRATLIDESPSPAFFSLALAPPTRPADLIEHGVGVESEKSIQYSKGDFLPLLLWPKALSLAVPISIACPTECPTEPSVQILRLPRRGNDTPTGSSCSYQ